MLMASLVVNHIEFWAAIRHPPDNGGTNWDFTTALIRRQDVLKIFP